jgi:hypothetical protein
MVQKFAANSHYNTRALQAYLILIGLAANRQTTTYAQLSEKMKYGVGPILASPLGCIMGWCYENRLPALTALVVGSETGLPGEGLYTETDLPAAQQKVFSFDWFSLFPPTLAELQEAGQRAAAGTLRAPTQDAS